ncbi:amino acid adenylation domain-containing protein [Streptomyces sp. NBC_01217]|uniref:amino acid adenylation domain-containing protein n=1 Tax=Streptomyces sp. NBC_01217 TaxID=2903779 RepID=UPI002E0D110A|nr:amino acid adenylation domain-containing protein [Streptomyces sp. NBC_01217]
MDDSHAGQDGVDLPLSPEAGAVLARYSRGDDDTALDVLLAVVAILLRRYHGDGPVALDVPAADIGMPGHTGTASLVVRFARGNTLRDVLLEVRDLVAALRDGAKGSSLPGPPTLKDRPLRADVLVSLGSPEPTTVDHDVTITLGGRDTDTLRISSPSGRVPGWFRSSIGAHLMSLIGLFEDSGRPASSVEEVVREHVEEAVRGFNATEQDFSTDRTVLELFRERVRLAPEAEAVISASRILSFADLRRHSLDIARDLRRRLGVSEGDVVAVLTARDHCAVTAVLGIMEAGARYLPLHPEWPQDKTRHILAQVGARALLVHERLAGPATAALGLPSLVLAPDAGPGAPEAEAAHEKAGNAHTGMPGLRDPDAPGPDDIAYIVFTSGTTGVPKGVAVAHRGLSNTVLDHIERFAMVPTDRYLQFMAASFDGFLLDIFSTLCAGAALVIADEDTIRDPGALMAWSDKHQATVSTITPSYLRLLDPARLAGLRILVSAGEAISPELAARLARHTTLYNGYGPTEATINSTLHRIDPHRGETSVPIGGPSANKKIYVVDNGLRQQPVGVVGEICIAGVGLAAGYVGDEGLTSEKFVPNPFSGGPRLYRTGDYGAWTPEGELLFRGRSDNQVKVNGYRIDLKELEDALRAHPEVISSFATTFTTSHGTDEIAVFFRSDTLDEEGVREHLASAIAEYMLPHRVVAVPDWPLTVHGKTDGAALRHLLRNQDVLRKKTIGRLTRWLHERAVPTAAPPAAIAGEVTALTAEERASLPASPSS